MDSKSRPPSEEPTEWQGLATLLLYWAHYVMLGVSIRGASIRFSAVGLPAIRGSSAEDFVADVIAKAIASGVRPGEAGVLHALKDQVFRAVYLCARRKENGTLHPASIEDLGINGSAKDLADTCKTPSEQMIESEETRLLEVFVKASNDDELIRYAGCIFEGVTMPKEFAAAMKISVERANYLRKKLRKYLAGYHKSRCGKSGLRIVNPSPRSISL